LLEALFGVLEAYATDNNNNNNNKRENGRRNEMRKIV